MNLLHYLLISPRNTVVNHYLQLISSRRVRVSFLKEFLSLVDLLDPTHLWKYGQLKLNLSGDKTDEHKVG